MKLEIEKEYINFIHHYMKKYI